MGAVYEVEDETTGGRFALKVMRTDDARGLLRFKQEFRLMAELYHPNLVRLFDLGQHDGQWFFTMELVHGEPLHRALVEDDRRATVAGTTASELASVLRASPPHADVEAGARAAALGSRSAAGRVACNPEALVGVVGQILDALEYLHERRIVHRDLKPSNVMVEVDGRVRVLDFGLASHADAARISQDGALVGTLAYLSPEQYRGGAASPASDLYALGCMMFELLAGEAPFVGLGAEQALAARTLQPPPRVDERVSDVPGPLAEIIGVLMAPEPGNRPTVNQVRTALGMSFRSRSSTLTPQPGSAQDATAETFVGRDREIAVLEGCLERAVGGRSQLALVSGPSGIGKSALASVLARRATRQGFLCLHGRCYERERVPFLAFDRVMDALALHLRQWPADELAPLLPPLARLSRIFPALRMLLPSEAALMAPRARRPADADPRELLGQVLVALQELLDALQKRAPLCLVLDDLQWADHDSMALIEAALASPAARMVVLGLHRPDGVDVGHPLQRLLRLPVGAGLTTQVALGALDAAEAARLVETVAHGCLGAGTAQALASQAAGSPFLLRRLAEHLATIAPPERGARLDEIARRATGDQFRSSDDLLAEMSRTLSAPAEEVLALAATTGTDIAARLLQESSGLQVEDFDLALDELRAARFLKAVPRAAGADDEPSGPALHVDSYHDRIREVTYRGLDADRRRRLHERLGLTLLAHRTAGDAETLLRHFDAAGDRERRRHFAIEAAEQAADRLAFVRAAQLFRVALEDSDPAEAPVVLARRWERAGELFEYGGHHREAAEAFGRALRVWDETHDASGARRVERLRLNGLVGGNLVVTGQIGEARDAFARGLSLLGLPLERPKALRLATLGGLKLRQLLAERVTARTSPRRDTPLRVAEVHFHDLLMLSLQALWPWPAAEGAMRAELLGRRIADHRVLHRSLAFGAVVPVLLGKCSPAALDRAHQRLDLAESLARKHDLPLGEELCQLNRSLVLVATNLERARRTCELALAGFERRGMLESFDGKVVRSFYLILLSYKGDDDDVLAAAARELDRTQPSFINVGVALQTRIQVFAHRGMHEAAQEALSRLESHLGTAPLSRLHFWLATASDAVLCAQGRFTEVLEGRAKAQGSARLSGAWAIGLDRTVWLLGQLEAAIGALRQRSANAEVRARAIDQASWVARRGVFNVGCLGYRALALLEHDAGRPKRAARALRQALLQSSANTGPWLRWMCLEAARDLDVMTPEQEAEAAELAATGRFVLPVRASASS